MAEVVFRLRQEVANAWMWKVPPQPRLRAPLLSLPQLPDPSPVVDLLRESPFAARLLEYAGRILTHRFPILGIEIDTGKNIRWRRDYVNGKETECRYFRRIPYLDVSLAGDHKVIWELNRHQHFVLLAQAALFSGRRDFVREIEDQLLSWLEQNPFQRGINWTSALEVAFRALSWLWTWHLVGNDLAATLRPRFLTALYQHGRHIECNLSIYFSPNTHLLGEAVVLHALGRLFPEWPRSRRWTALGDEVVRCQLERQVLSDGAHFELSSYYHVYALDFFLLHYMLAGRPAEFEPVLARMTEYLDALLGVPRAIPFLGDDDGGRLFYPYGNHSEYGRATVATAALALRSVCWPYAAEDLFPQAVWWMGKGAVQPAPASSAVTIYVPKSRVFSVAGLVEMSAGPVQVLFDVGSFGGKRGGHSHSDALNLIVRRAEEDILIDSGTYTYVGDPEWRDRFRGSEAHNTIQVDGRDQGQSAGPFGWLTQPSVELREFSSDEIRDYAAAGCSYENITLCRRILLSKPDSLLLVLDSVETSGEHLVEQFWHLADPKHRVLLAFAGNVVRSEERVFRSRALGQREPISRIRVSLQGECPVYMAAALDFGGPGGLLTLEQRPEGVRLVYSSDSRCVCALFPLNGDVAFLR